MLEFLPWIFLLGLFTLAGAWYVKKFDRPDALIGLYVAFVVFSNIAAQKIAVFDFGVAQFFAPAVVIIFSVTFLITDIVNEKFGRVETHKMILVAFLAQIAVSVLSVVVLSIPSAPFWQNQNLFESLFGQVPRIIFASWIAFLISENLDAVLFQWFKQKTNGKHLWARNMLSSIPAMAIDSVLFVTIAFYGVQPVVPIIIGQIAIKWFVGVVNIPFMYANRHIMFSKN